MRSPIRPTLSAILLLLSAGIHASASGAEITVSERGELIRALQQATPGTTLRVAPGNYQGGISAEGLQGQQDKPILITAADAKRPPVFEGGSSGIHLRGCSHVELRDLHFTGATSNGVNIDDNADRSRAVQGIKLTRLHVSKVGPRGNCDGIKMSGVDNFLIEGCDISLWGTSGSGIDLVGCHQGIIENCRFSHDATITTHQGNGVQAKGGSREVTIRKCRFHHAGARGVNAGGSTGLEYMRPADPGFEAKDLTIEDCYFIGSGAAVAFVGVDGATFRHNTIYRPTRWVLRILQENQREGFAPCRNGVFQNNLIVFHAGDLSTTANVGPATEAQSFRFEDNAWYCVDEPASTQSRIRLPVQETSGVHGKDPGFKDAAGGDLTKSSGTPLPNHGVREAK